MKSSWKFLSWGLAANPGRHIKLDEWACFIWYPIMFTHVHDEMLIICSSVFYNQGGLGKEKQTRLFVVKKLVVILK